MNDDIGAARVQLLRMHTLVTELRLQYWLCAAIAVTSAIACLGGMTWAVMVLTDRAAPAKGLDPVGVLVIAAGIMLATGCFAIWRMSLTGVIVRGLRQQIDHLTKATLIAEEEALAAMREPRSSTQAVTA